MYGTDRSRGRAANSSSLYCTSWRKPSGCIAMLLASTYFEVQIVRTIDGTLYISDPFDWKRNAAKVCVGRYFVMCKDRYVQKTTITDNHNARRSLVIHLFIHTEEWTILYMGTYLDKVLLRVHLMKPSLETIFHIFQWNIFPLTHLKRVAGLIRPEKQTLSVQTVWKLCRIGKDRDNWQNFRLRTILK